MIATSTQKAPCQTEQAILHALFYFEIFSYPLTATEVLNFCEDPATNISEVSEKLQELVQKGTVFQFDGFFQTQNEPNWVSRRKENNLRADQFLPMARRIASFIGAFPFVRCVCVSGSLSKHAMSPDSDIDFFVITEPGRLWLARTILIVFKKTFLFNSHKYFCVNYFIDTNHLQIEEKNRFTATETATLLPMYGREYFEAFRQENGWAWAQYPHFPPRETAGIPVHSKSWMKNILEMLLRGPVGAWLDERFMRLTVGFWKRKFKHLENNDFSVALKSRRYVSKHHPLHFQQKVLQRFEERVRQAQATENAE